MHRKVIVDEKTYDYLDIILVANDALLCAKGHTRVVGVGRAESIHPHERLPAILHPAPRKRPRGALPYIIRAERLELLPCIDGAVEEDDARVERRRGDGVGAVLAEGGLADGEEGGLGERAGEVAVYGGPGFVFDC